MCFVTPSDSNVPIRVVERRCQTNTRIATPRARPRSRHSDVEVVYASSSPRHSIVSDPRVSYTTIKRTHSRSRSQTLIPAARSSAGSHHHGRYLEVVEPGYNHHHHHLGGLLGHRHGDDLEVIRIA